MRREHVQPTETYFTRKLAELVQLWLTTSHVLEIASHVTTLLVCISHVSVCIHLDVCIMEAVQ